MTNKIFKISTLVLVAIVMSGCSNNIKRYKLGLGLVQQVKAYNPSYIEIESVTMPKGDTNRTICRLNSSISLPDKMKYSDYIKDALSKTVTHMNEGKSCNPGHKLKVELTNVSVNTFNTKWSIDANVTVDNNKPVVLNTESKHNFSYVAGSACLNAANAFDEATDNFIKQLFIHPTISKQLK